MYKSPLLFLIVSILLGSCQKFSYNSPSQVKETIGSVVKISVQYIAEDKITLASMHRGCIASGFSIAVNDNKSYVLTNKHVCEMQRAAEYKLLLSTGEVMSASFIRSDSFADICLLEANGVIPSLTLAERDATQGDRIITIGAPDSAFPIVVDGVISGYYDMNMQNALDDDGPFEVHFRAQVMSAPIYHGSSGSPVINVYGSVVGIVFAVRNDKEHIAFMVPVNEILRFLDRAEYVHMN